MTARKTLVLTLLLAASGCTVFVDRELDRAAERHDEQGDGDTGGDAEDAGRDGSAGDHPGYPMEHADSGAKDDADTEAGDAGAGSDGGQGHPKEPLLKLAIGIRHACALDLATHDLTCWGENQQQQRDGLTGGKYQDVSCGDYHTCAIDLQGTLWCIGRNVDGQAPQRVDGNFQKVAAGNAHTCAQQTDGRLRCWGAGSAGSGTMQATPPTTAFDAIAAGEDVTCGIRQDNQHVHCWGTATTGRKSPPLGVAFQSIDMGRAHGCGVTTEGGVLCWGDAMYAVPRTLIDMHQVAAGQYRTCALRDDGLLECWLDGPEPLPQAWNTKFSLVAAGDQVVCALSEMGKLQCLAAGSHPVVDVPSQF